MTKVSDGKKPSGRLMATVGLKKHAMLYLAGFDKTYLQKF